MDKTTQSQNRPLIFHDELGQLTRENLAGKKTSVWNYDELGNITSKSEYAYTTVADLKNETVNKTVKYYYPDDEITYQDSTKTTKTYSSWNNILVAVDLDGSNDVANNEIIEYDQIGNPTSYLGATLKWNGRQLTSYTKGNNAISYKYDADGLRTTKTVNGVTSKYFYVNGQLHYEERSNGTKLYFFYDSNGYLTGLEYNNTMYYPATNRRGDVVAIYNKTGNCIVRYEYDAWGNVIAVVDDSGINLAEINPIRYRGYYYDTETKLYYLQSRYYNPEIGRFLNSDSISDSGAGVLGYNTFIYCANNPVNATDPSGHSLLATLAVKFAVGAIVNGAVDLGIQLVKNGGDFSKVDWGRTLKSAVVGGATSLISFGISSCVAKISNVAVSTTVDILSNGVTNVIQETGTKLLNGESMTVVDAGKSFAQGLLIGSLSTGFGEVAKKINLRSFNKMSGFDQRMTLRTVNNGKNVTNKMMANGNYIDKYISRYDDSVGAVCEFSVSFFSGLSD